MRLDIAITAAPFLRELPMLELHENSSTSSECIELPPQIKRKELLLASDMRGCQCWYDLIGQNSVICELRKKNIFLAAEDWVPLMLVMSTIIHTPRVGSFSMTFDD